MKAYLDIVKKIMDQGVLKKNRTGTDTWAVAGAMFEHDMKDGFPLLTTKTVPFRLVSSELEFFIKGITDKQWLKDKNNHIWDEWCSPTKVPYGHSDEIQKKMAEERDLGPIYGFQWRNFGANYTSYNNKPASGGIDQLKIIVDRLKENPDDRRMICMAWNPVKLSEMALPPCHYGFQITVIDGKLNLLWNQRSVDVALGLPFNIASYALMLHLLAKESGLKEGKLVGFLADVHIYVNHMEGMKKQASRTVKSLSQLKTEPFNSIFDWTYEESKIHGYEHHPHISYEVAI